MTAQASQHGMPSIPEPWSSMFGFSRRQYAYELRSNEIGFKLSDARVEQIAERRAIQAERRAALLEYVRANGNRTTGQIAEKLEISADRAYRDLTAMRNDGAMDSVTVDGQRVWRINK
jgi:predicted HTH transcriptional regulator